MSDFFGHDLVEVSLRDYQQTTITMLDTEVAAGAEAPLLVLPTGAGKTRIACALMSREIARGGKALFLAPRRELITQCSRTLRDHGLAHGVILAGAGHLEASDQPIQVGSVDTLISRMFRRRQSLDLPRFTMVIVDEAHLACTERRRDLVEAFGGALVIGLTATPTRKDGRALGLMFDALIQPVGVADLTEQGYLVKARYFSLSEPDLKRVRTTAGDYNAKDLDAAVNKSELVGDIVSHWIKHAYDRRTVVFCTSIAHSVAVCDNFLRVGIAAEHVDASTPTAEREMTFERFKSGQTQILTNCFLASYGFDLPALSCVILARPTKSLMLYLQMIGRGLRPADGKADCLILDHSGCVHMHGFAADERPWSLDGRMSFTGGSDGEDSVQKTVEHKPIDCPECNATFSKTIVCPECGYRLKPAARDVENTDGSLVELGGENKRLGDPRFFAELRGYARNNGYKTGWAAYKYKEKYGVMPPYSWNNDPAAAPSIETSRWIRSRQIAWAKSQQKRATA